ncbi:MAG: 3-deoxy-D-manno-octulosonic acid transferase [Planctomycetes bacterium]|nr:3-deoxy-D-manno-octulosonic acid transferase [Planctomycetota bacterium]
MFVLDFVYIIYIIIASPYYLFKFATSHYHRQGLPERFGFIGKREGTKKCIWLHGASVGEINASEILIRKIQKLYPDYELVISTTTPSAQKLVKKRYPGIVSFLFPIDLGIIIRRVLNRIKPSLIILIEQELWFNLIRLADYKNIPVILLNGRMTKHSTRRYRLIKPLIRRIWNKVSYFCVQNEEYRERLRHLGIHSNKLKITGNMKYDLLDSATASAPGRSYKQVFGINDDDLVIIAGSTHPPEEEIMLDIYSDLRKKFTNLRLIIAPRHPFRFEDVAKLVSTKGFEISRRSNPPATMNKSAIMLLDTLGELNKVYQIADIVFVGGSMIPHGGQSILEPAAAGKPIVFGPDMSNFQDIANQLIKENAAMSVSNKSGLHQALLSLLAEPERRNRIGTKAREVISRYQGATTQNMEFIRKLVDHAVKI